MYLVKRKPIIIFASICFVLFSCFAKDNLVWYERLQMTLSSFRPQELLQGCWDDARLPSSTVLQSLLEIHLPRHHHCKWTHRHKRTPANVRSGWSLPSQLHTGLQERVCWTTSLCCKGLAVFLQEFSQLFRVVVQLFGTWPTFELLLISVPCWFCL